MDRAFVSGLIAIGLFVGMLVLLEWGRRIGRRRQGKDEEGARALAWERWKARCLRSWDC